MKQNVIQTNVPLKQFTQSDNIQSHITQEALYLQQKQLNNPIFNGYPHTQTQDNQYPGQYSNKQENFHVQQGIGSTYEQKIDKYQDYLKPQYSPNSSSSSNSNQTGKDLKINEQEFLPEFAASKSDPKYQTLPYNTKFPQNNGKKSENKNENQDPKNAINVNHMTVHSTPLSVVNKSLATPLSQTETYQQESTYQLQKSDSSSRCNQEGKENHAYPQNRLSQNNLQNDSKSSKNQQSSILKGSSPSLGSSTTGSSSIGFGVSHRSYIHTTLINKAFK